MATLPKTRTVTYEEWLNMPVVQDEIEEVVNGEIRLMPPNKLTHTFIVDNIADALKSQLDRRKIRVFTTSFGLVIRREPLTTRAPDIAVFELSTLVEQDGHIHSAPQLVVEVLSPANRRNKQEEKLRDYESLGVPEVWMFCPEARTIEVVLIDGRLRREAVLAEGFLKPKRFPHVEIDIAQVWPD
jgi:Uma2 family endonuclease